MTSASVITAGCVNAIVLALTPVERWRAAREFNANFMAERWFVLIGIIAIAMFLPMINMISKRVCQEKRANRP